MARFVEMDELVTISKQMEEDIGPVIFINKFNVNPVDVDEFLKRWAAEATVFKQQPGFISAQLHRGIAGSGTFINYAVWESTAHLKRAVNNVDVQARLSEYPASIVISPHIFKKVAVPGICVG
ncbi:MAG: antibiotic biosynthesis monooxygenase family protein [Nitrososphaeraceae archaeon]